MEKMVMGNAENVTMAIITIDDAVENTLIVQTAKAGTETVWI
jgi:hypothetical protein